MPKKSIELSKVFDYEKKGKRGKENRKRRSTERSGEDEGKEPEAISAELRKFEGVISTRKSHSEKRYMEPRRPTPDTFSPELRTIEFKDSLVERKQEEGTFPVRPRERLTEIDNFTFSIRGIRIFRLSEKNLAVRKPAKVISEEEYFIASLRELESFRRQTDTMEKVELKKRSSTREEEEIEIEEKDPFFTWPIGSPYASRTPKLILIEDREEIPVLETLKILLRDTYREIEGGEPGAYPVEFIANEPKFPEIQGNIVTLDLTDSWNASLENGEPSIKRGGLDIVPQLKEISQTMFTGELGFLVVSLTPEWESSWRLGEDFIEKLESHLAASKAEDQLPPVLKADSNKEVESFWRTAHQYFGVKESPISDLDTISQLEEIRNIGLRRADWRKVSITNKSSTNEERIAGESDEHYFLKASIAEGFAHECFTHYREDEPELSFDDFFQKYVLDEDWVKTEEKIEKKEEEAPKADIYISLKEANSTVSNSTRKAMGSFFKPEPKENPEKFYLEVETGRSEGAFNFRKLREKVENYQNRLSNLWIVIPSRLLFRGKKRAKMVLNIVTKGSKNEKANLASPILSKWGCSALRKIDENYIDKVYGEIS